MDWVQVIIVVGANLTVFLGFMGTVIALHLQSCKKIDAIQDEMKDFHSKYMEETKSFHARLCVIEERRTKVLLDQFN